MIELLLVGWIIFGGWLWEGLDSHATHAHVLATVTWTCSIVVPLYIRFLNWSLGISKPEPCCGFGCNQQDTGPTCR